MNNIFVEISVVVCTYKRPDLLARCLDSLSVQTLCHTKYEVIVVDNDPGKSAFNLVDQYLKKIYNLKYFCEASVGLSKARNCGWQKAIGEYVAFIDDDAIADEQWCEKILSAFSAIKPKPSSVGGPIYPWTDCELPKWFSEELEIRSWGDIPLFLNSDCATVGFSGSNMAFPKQLIGALGGFDLSFGMTGGQVRMGEDTEFFHRLHMHSPGFWYAPDAIVKHYVSMKNLTLKGRFIRWFHNGYSREKIEMNSHNIFNVLCAFAKLPVFAFIIVPYRLVVYQKKKYQAIKVIQDFAFLCGRAFGAIEL